MDYHHNFSILKKRIIQEVERDWHGGCFWAVVFRGIYITIQYITYITWWLKIYIPISIPIKIFQDVIFTSSEKMKHNSMTKIIYSKSDLDMLTSPWRGPPCLAFVDGRFSVWPHVGSIALGYPRGRTPEAGVAEERWSLAWSTEARRRAAASARQSRSSPALTPLEADRKITHLQSCQSQVLKCEWSYPVVYRLLCQPERGCGCLPWMGWTVHSGPPPGSGTAA